MNVLIGIAVALCLQDEATNFTRFKVGTKWVYTVRDPDGDYTSASILTESQEGGIILETRRSGAGWDPARKIVQNWIIKDGFLMMDSVPVFKLGSKKGDQWTYPLDATVATATHEGVDELRVPAGLYKDVVHMHQVFGGAHLHFWFSPAAGIIKTQFELGPKVTVIELQEFASAPAEKPPSGPGERPAPKPAAPRPQKAYTKPIDPWERQEAGAWYRFKVTVADKEYYDDVGLKTKSDAGNTLLAQSSKEPRPEPATEALSKPVMVQVVGEETLRIQSRSYLCEIRSPIAADGTVVISDREWTVKEGKHAGALLKADSPKRTLLANKVWDNTIRVKGREFDCWVVEAESKTGDQAAAVKTWFFAGLPRAVRFESDETSSVLVDFGTDWSKRPMFPGGAPPERK